MIASLPMYDLPAMQGANDRYWQAIRMHLGEGPAHLTRKGDLWDHWLSPDLILSQTCGYPFRARLHGRVTLVGTPDYGLPDCPPGHYNSVLIARSDDTRSDLRDFATARFAFNEALSQSGWAAPQTYAAARGFAFTNIVQTGGHRASALAVAEGRAEIAAIDALTWALLKRDEAFAAALKELERTDPTPVLPYITALGRDGPAHFAAIKAAIADLTLEDRALLHLKGLVRIGAKAYLAVPTPAGPPGA